MNYNVDEWTAATEHPSLTINGKTYQGRLLSYQEMMPFLKRLDTIKDNGGEDFASFAVDYLNLVFPPSKIVRWKPSLVSQILQLPNVAQVVARFLEVQTKAMGITSPDPETNGTSQPQKP
jgi:hypothetical protein